MMILRRYISKLLASLTLLMLFASNLYAAPSADSKQPVNIKSNKVDFDHNNSVATYTGKVSVDQGDRQLLSEKLIIHRGKDNKIKVIIATGNPATFHSQARYSKPASTGQAKIIKYYPEQDKVDLFDNAEITQNGDTVKGPILNYDFTTGNLKSASSADERATFILQPKRQS